MSGKGRERPMSKNSFVTVEVDLALSAQSNAGMLFALKKKSASKQERTEVCCAMRSSQVHSTANAKSFCLSIALAASCL